MAKWRGYITFGFTDAARVQQAIAACFDQEDFEALKVEPGRIFNAAGSTRRKLEVWNQNRTHVRDDSECRPKHYDNTDPYVLNYSGSPDDIRLAGGYQIDVVQQSPQSLLIRSIVGGGELGSPIDEIPLYAGEAPPAGSDHLDGGVSCSKVLRSINGVSNPHFIISTTMGVIVKSHPLLNRIVIDVNGDGLTFCAGGTVATTVDCLPASTETCGPAEGVTVLCPGAPDDRGGYKDINSVDDPGYGSPLLDLNVVYGTCEYRKGIEGWELLTANPSFNCQCSVPVIGAYLGQLVTTRAVPLPREEPYWVRNGDFSDGLTFWQIDADTSAIGTDEDLFGGMPYAEVDNGTISQPFITLDARMIRVQFNYICPETVTLKVINQRNGEVLLNHTYPAAEENTEILSDFFTTTGTDASVTFETEGILQISEVLIVPWQ